MRGVLYREEEGYYLYVNSEVIGTTRPLFNLDYIKYKLNEEQCDELFDGESIQVEVGMINQLNIESGLFEWKYRLDSNGCLIIEKKIL
jgi:hypothetical protein